MISQEDCLILRESGWFSADCCVLAKRLLYCCVPRQVHLRIFPPSSLMASLHYVCAPKILDPNCSPFFELIFDPDKIKV